MSKNKDNEQMCVQSMFILTIPVADVAPKT